MTLEKTPKYFVAGAVPQRIISTYRGSGIEPKFVLVLCDPVQRTYSDFMFSKRNGNESYINQVGLLVNAWQGEANAKLEKKYYDLLQSSKGFD